MGTSPSTVVALNEPQHGTVILTELNEKVLRKQKQPRHARDLSVPQAAWD